MEGSFSRSKLLNSRIQHAADNYYSVNRGENRIISINEIGCTDIVNVKKFDLISTYGNYKLCYSQDYSHTQLFELFGFNAYLALDIISMSLTGNGKLYLDIPDTNISEDIQIIRELDGYEYKISNLLSDLYSSDPTIRTDICVMTMPNYSVRLWKATPFLKTETLNIKYLKSPDQAIQDLNLTDIKSIPKYVKSDSTVISEYKKRIDKLADLDLIYLYSANYVKFKDTIKSVNSLNTEVQEYFPEFLGFNITIDNGSIKVYYTMSYDYPGNSVDSAKVLAFQNKMKAYYIYQDIEFIKAEKVDLDGFTIEIKYMKELRFDICDNLLRSYQADIGKNFNPYQIIADLMSNTDLLGKIKLVTIPIEKMQIIELTDNQRIVYSNLTINYVSME